VDGIAQDARFDYVHSYYVKPQDANLIQATSDYPLRSVRGGAREIYSECNFTRKKPGGRAKTAAKLCPMESLIQLFTRHANNSRD